MRGGGSFMDKGRERIVQVPGLSATSLAAALFGLLATGILIQYSEIIALIAFPAEHTLPVPVICVLLVLIGMGALFHLLTRVKLLTRAEMLCVLYILLFAAPLMTQGFWHRFVSILATNPRQADFAKLDAMHDSLWPHGPDLLSDAFSESRRGRIETRGAVGWESIDLEEGAPAVLPVLANPGEKSESALRIVLPVGGLLGSAVQPGDLYMVSVLARAVELGPEARYGCNFYADDGQAPVHLFSSTARPKRDVMHRAGFQRVGAYGVKIPAEARRSVTVEFWLSGAGRLELARPKLFSVEALERLYTGRKLVTQGEYDRLPLEERPGLVVRPDRLWSLAGLKYLLSGYIMARDWWRPVGLWTVFVLLLLAGTFAVNVILRRQWMENERFQMPVTRLPLALMDDDDRPGGVLAPIWRNRLMWAGFGVTLLWELMKAWNFYNPKVPCLAVNLSLQPYFSGPGWGGTWQGVRFEVVAIFLALCIFMELNVLISLVAGYLAFRSLHAMGQMTGWNADPDYPFGRHQMLGAYLGYAVAILFFARRYLGRVLVAAVRGRRAGDGEPEVFSYRAAVVLLLAAVAGAAVWAGCLGMSVAGMLVFFACLLAVGLVAARIRTECGAPWGYFAPANVALFLVLFGGIGRFGGEMLMFAYVLSFMIAPTVFFLIPGAQIELLELGRRWHVRGRDLVWCAALGVLGGMAVGGWVFLSNAYAIGGNNIRYDWAFDTKWWYFFSYNQELNSATAEWMGQGGAAAAGRFDPAVLAACLAGAGAICLTVVRQFFAGFWFHPVGFILGASQFMDYIWGSALAAWIIRTVVLRLGGAETVRNKLQPVFIGVFLGGVAAYGVLTIHSAHLRAMGVERIYAILMSA